MVIEGMVEFDTEDSGCAMIGQVDRDGNAEERGLFVRIHSWDEGKKHADARLLEGKRVRVTIDILMPVDKMVIAAHAYVGGPVTGRLDDIPEGFAEVQGGWRRPAASPCSYVNVYMGSHTWCRCAFSAKEGNTFCPTHKRTIARHPSLQKVRS